MKTKQELRGLCRYIDIAADIKHKRLEWNRTSSENGALEGSYENIRANKREEDEWEDLD
jgi:hypothetical protein